MLTSLVIQFTPAEPVNLPRDLGRASHALFLRLLSTLNAELTNELHASGDIKPFTCSNVHGGKHREGSLIAAPGDQLWVRYTGLTAPVSQLLTAIPAQLPAESTVEIEGVQFKVTGATMDSSINPPRRDYQLRATQRAVSDGARHAGITPVAQVRLTDSV